MYYLNFGAWKDLPGVLSPVYFSPREYWGPSFTQQSCLPLFRKGAEKLYN